MTKYAFGISHTSRWSRRSASRWRSVVSSNMSSKITGTTAFFAGRQLISQASRWG